MVLNTLFRRIYNSLKVNTNCCVVILTNVSLLAPTLRNKLALYNIKNTLQTKLTLIYP